MIVGKHYPIPMVFDKGHKSGFSSLDDYWLYGVIQYHEINQISDLTRKIVESAQLCAVLLIPSLSFNEPSPSCFDSFK